MLEKSHRKKQWKKQEKKNKERRSRCIWKEALTEGKTKTIDKKIETNIMKQKGWDGGIQGM